MNDNLLNWQKRLDWLASIDWRGLTDWLVLWRGLFEVNLIHTIVGIGWTEQELGCKGCSYKATGDWLGGLYHLIQQLIRRYFQLR